MIRDTIKKSKMLKSIYLKFRERRMMILCKISPVLATNALYKRIFKHPPDLKHPKTFNEKILWLKLNTYKDNELITQCVDKYRVREYIENCGYGNILDKLIGVYNRPEDIEWSNLPKQFVLKLNTGSGYNIVCKNKDNLDENKAKKKLKKWMKEDYSLKYADIQYKNVRPKIICEEYLADDIVDYKFFCFNGVPEFLYISKGLGDKDYLQMAFYTCDWKEIDIERYGYHRLKEKIVKPQNYDEMLEISKRLSKDFPFVRVDLYNINGKIYFSELTFVPTAGVMKVTPEEKLIEWGNLLKI